MLDNQDGKVDDQITKKLKVKTVLKSKKKCFFSFAFNKSSTILFVGSVSQIKLLGFNSKFKQILTLMVGESYVSQILFLKKSNLLVLGNHNGQIFIYEMNFQWKLHQKIQNHTTEITCIINNESEDLLITSSYLGQISIWKKHNQIWKCQQTIRISFQISNLSLNSSGTIIIFHENYYTVVVIELQNNSEWNIIQRIKVNQINSNIGFISETKFILIQKQNIQFYEQKEKQFVLAEQFLIENCSHCGQVNNGLNQVINQNNILLIRLPCFINYFKKVQNQDYVLQHSIKYSCKSLVSRIADSGQFLISWNYENKASLLLTTQVIQIDFIKL